MPIGGQDGLLGCFDFVDRVGNFEIQLIGRKMQTLGMSAAFEDFAIVGPLALKHRRRIVQRMRQDMDIRITPWLHFAIHPDHSVAIVIASHGRPPIAKVA